MAIFSAAMIAAAAIAVVMIAVAAAAADIHRRTKREGAHRLPPFLCLLKKQKREISWPLSPRVLPSAEGTASAEGAGDVARSGELFSAERSLTVPPASRRLGRAPSPPRLFPEHAIRRKNQKETSMRGGFSLEKFGMGIGWEHGYYFNRKYR